MNTDVCPLCGLSIEEQEESLSYCHFINDSSDRLYEYSNCSFHRPCFDSWKHKVEYKKKFEDFLNDSFSGLESLPIESLDDDDLLEDLI
jgi:hypothetical protein